MSKTFNVFVVYNFWGNELAKEFKRKSESWFSKPKLGLSFVTGLYIHQTLCDTVWQRKCVQFKLKPSHKTHPYHNFAHLSDLFSVSKTTRELLLKWSNEPVRLSSEVSPQKVENPLKNYQTSFIRLFTN